MSGWGRRGRVAGCAVALALGCSTPGMSEGFPETFGDGSATGGTATSAGSSTATGGSGSGSGSATGTSGPSCGDMIITPPEQCEVAIGCDDNCQITDVVDAFRMSTLAIADPPLWIPASDPMTDPTCGGNLTTQANAVLEQRITMDSSGDGYLDLGVLLLFRPLRRTYPVGHLEVDAASCTAPVDTTSCDVQSGKMPTKAQYDNLQDSDCYDPVAGEIDPVSMAPSKVTPPCFRSDPVEFSLDLGGLPLPLVDAVLSGRFTTDDHIVGVLRGFLEESYACNSAQVFPDSVAIVGGHRIGDLLGDDDPSCGCPMHADDLDAGPNGQRGWYFNATFEADRVPYTGN